LTLYKQRERFSRLSVKIGLVFSRVPLSPNQWTMLSLAPAFVALYFLVQERFLLAGVFFIASAFLDLVDGSVARVTGTASRFGAYLDTVIDRYVEALIAFGLLFTPLPSVVVPAHVWIFLYLFGSMTTTYAKAAAKEKELITEGKELTGGLLERAERLIILFAGIVLAAANPLYLTYVVVLLAVLTNISALQRVLAVRRLAHAG
jgi:phosphatidylglycerophosphate synthase